MVPEELKVAAEGALRAVKAIQDDIIPMKDKLDGFDKAKYSQMVEDVAIAVEAGQKAKAAADAVEAEKKAREKEVEQLQAAINRLSTAPGTAEEKSKELRRKAKKLFNDFARLKDDENKRYFDAYLKNSVTDEMEYKALAVNSDPNGGYLTTPDFGGVIQTYIYETSPMRQLCSVIEIGTDTFEVLLDNGQAGTGWVGETQSRTNTTTPVLGKLQIPVNELYAEPQITQKMLDDAILDVEHWLAMKVGEVMARTENTAFVAGSGVLQPKGILSYASGTNVAQAQIQQITTGSSSTFTYAGLVNLQASLKEEYQANATFLIQRSSIANLLNIVDGISRPIFNLRFDKDTGIEQGIMGRPLRFGNDVPAVASSSLAMIYGDFKKGYQIVDRAGVRVLRDPYTAKPYINFYTTKRTGGAVLNYEALKIHQIHS